MNALLPFLALGLGMALAWAGALAGWLGFLHLRTRLARAEALAAASREEMEASLAQTQRNLEALAAKARQPPPAAEVPSAPRGCLNLSKRSQALRLHRRGDAPREIAAQLEIPLQEVELLLKVHEIVMRAV